MRHLVGLVLGVVIAPVLLYALGWGTTAVAASWSAGSGSLTADGMAAAGILALAGVAIAALTRGLPPLGALVVGAVFAALTALNVLYASAVGAVLQPVGAGVVEIDWTGARGLLEQGVVGVLGVALLLSATPPGRWRRETTQSDEDYISYLADGPDPAWTSGQTAYQTGGHVQPVPLPTTGEPAPGRREYGPHPGVEPGRGQHERG